MRNRGQEKRGQIYFSSEVTNLEPVHGPTRFQKLSYPSQAKGAAHAKDRPTRHAGLSAPHRSARSQPPTCLRRAERLQTVSLRHPRAKEQCSTKVFSYCLMTNHVHLLVSSHTPAVWVGSPRATGLVIATGLPCLRRSILMLAGPCSRAWTTWIPRGECSLRRTSHLTVRWLWQECFAPNPDVGCHRHPTSCQPTPE